MAFWAKELQGQTFWRHSLSKSPDFIRLDSFLVSFAVIGEKSGLRPNGHYIFDECADVTILEKSRGCIFDECEIPMNESTTVS